MIKNKFFSDNKIIFINYFIIKKDREKLASFLIDSRTKKIFDAKNGGPKNIKVMTQWISKELSNEEIVFIPFPSTDKSKKKNGQLPYALVKELSLINKKWIDGSGFLYRKHSLSKNTRKVKEQFDSLGLKNGKFLKGKNIIILDDVVTSGSSLLAGIKKVSEAEPNLIRGMALAKKVYVKEMPLTAIY